MTEEELMEKAKKMTLDSDELLTFVRQRPDLDIGGLLDRLKEAVEKETGEKIAIYRPLADQLAAAQRRRRPN